MDESTLSLRAASILSTHQIFSFSTWQNGGLITVYSLLFYIFGNCNIAYLRVFQAVASILAVLLSFKIFKTMYGVRVGFIAALLLSLMPYSVFFSN